MSESAPIDLAQAAGWHGIAPGLTRVQVTEILAAQNIALAAYHEDRLTAGSDDAWEMEFHFTTDGTERLRQVSVDGDDLLWNGRPLSAPLDEVLLTLMPHGLALWTNYDAADTPFPDETDSAASKPTDEDLLEEGTVWLPERGLGLTVCGGVVFQIIRRAPEDLPRRYAGPVTEAQRKLSRRPDLEEHLLASRSQQPPDESPVEPPRKPFAAVRTLLTIAAVAAIAWIVKSGIETTRLWAQAEVIQGRLVAFERVPMKQFRDFLPPAMRWVLPVRREVIVEAYRVAYTAPDGRRGEVLLERGDLYVPPAALDTEVPIAFLPSDPPQVKGLSRARDTAFLEHTPLAIGVGVLYFAARFLLSVLPTLLRFVARFATGSQVRS